MKTKMMKTNRNLQMKMRGWLAASGALRHLQLTLALVAALTLVPLCFQTVRVSAAHRAAASPQQSAPTQLTITLSSQGMTPASATVGTGIVHLRIENQSGQDHLTLRLSRDSGELVREISLPDKTPEITTELELKTGGQYVLSEASNTSWKCSLTAQAPPSSGGLLPGV